MTSASRKAAIARLRRHLEKIERPLVLHAGRDRPAPDAIALLPGALHEARAADWRDGPAAAGFALALAAQRARKTGKAVLFLQAAHEARRSGAPFARGLSLHGVDLAAFAAVFARDSRMLLWAAEEAARSTSITAAIVETPADCALLDLTATRRLQLAAASSGAAVILLRRERAPGATAAGTRWRVRPAPSAEDPDDAKAPGRARWIVTIERCRKGGRGAFLVEQDDDARIFICKPTISGPLAAALADGPAEAAA